MIAFLLAACANDPPPSPDDGWALDDPAFRFCHTPGANAEDARRWCELLPADRADDRCPGLRATCDDGVVTADPVPLGCSPDVNDPLAGRFAGAPDAPPAEPPHVDCTALDSDALQATARWAAAFAVAFGVFLVARLVWGTFGRVRRTPRLPPVPEVVPLHTSVEDDDLPAAPSTNLLDAARRALAAGQLGDAVRFARAAALRRLGEQGRLVLHRARTDREYLRALAKEAGLQGWLRVLLDTHALARWGGRLPSHASAQAAIAAAERIVVAVVVLLMLALPAHAQSYARYAPDGDAALLRLLELHGYAPGFRLRSLTALDDKTDVLVLDVTAVGLRPEQWDALATWVSNGGVLLVAGNASPGFPDLGSWQAAPEHATVALGPALDGLVPPPVLPGGPAGGFTGGEPWAVVAGTDLRFLAVLPVDAGAVVALADARLLSNGAWVSPENEQFVGELLRAGGWALAEGIGDTGDKLVVQLATTAAASSPGSGEPGVDPFGAIAEARLLPLVLQLLATAALVLLWRGWAFGRLREPVEEGRRAFVEHVQALGTRYYRLGASAHALRAVAALWLARLGPEGLEWAAARAGYAPDDAKAFARWVVATAEAEAGGSDPADLDRMEELWRVTRRSG